MSDNPYLRGNYAPVADERTETDLPVTGTLPPALDGLLLRDGPNPAGIVGDESHWFVGDGMIHAIELGGGAARSYRNRWIRTPALEEATELPAAPQSPHDMGMGSGNVNVVEHAGRILGLGEIGLPWELTSGLDTVGQYDFDGGLTGSMTAHPKIDPEIGEMLFFGYDPFGPPFLRYHRVDREGLLVETRDIDIPQCTMMHDWGVTASRVVFMDLPVVFDLELLSADMGTMPFRWDDDTPARLGVMARAGETDVTWIDIEPCYVFHPLNAFDDGDLIVMDVVRYPRMFATSRVGPHEATLGTLHRWVIDSQAGVVKEEQLDDRTIEFPRIDDRFAGRPHRWGFATEITGNGGFDTGVLVRYDLLTGENVTHDLGAGRQPGEGVFVAASDDAAEGEGWVLTVVHDAATDRSDVVVIDAVDFSAEPVATVHLPVRVPFGFHGNWVPRANLEAE